MELQTIQDMLKDPKEMTGALYGTLLGDTSMGKPNPGNSRVTFGQNNKAYAYWKYQIFSSLGFCEPVLYGSTWRSQTPRLPMFTKIYNKIYHNGRKTVSVHGLKTLTPLGLALLYCDDGDLHKAKQEVKIATMGFNEAEHELLQKGLFKRFGLRFNPCQRKSYGGNRKDFYWYLRLKQSDVINFFSVVSEFIPDCMSYKVPTAAGMDKLVNHSRKSRQDIDELLSDSVLFQMRFIDELSLTQMSDKLDVNSGTILGRIRKLEAKLLDCLHQDIV